MSLKAAVKAAARTDLYTDPPSETYVLGTVFRMPTKEGGRLAIAVSFRVGLYLIPIFTLIVTGIFYFVWQFITYTILMAAPGKPTPTNNQDPADPEKARRRANRDITLLSVWNSGNPWTAVVPLLKHTWRMFFSAKDTKTGGLDIIILLLTVVAMLCNWGISIYVPGNLAIGNAAPANPSKVLFPVQNYVGSDRTRLQALVAPGTQRSLGIVEAASESLKERVSVSNLRIMPWKGSSGEIIEQVTYSYNITGVDLGLQHASGLFNRVEGACTLEYGWYDLSNKLYDAYNIPSNTPKNLSLDTSSAPAAYIYRLNRNQSNTTYGVIFDTVNRYSYSPSNDAMYYTGGAAQVWQVKRGRPALSCWQSSNWTYKENTTSDVASLGDITGPDLPSVLQRFTIFCFAQPRIILLTESLGPAALIASTSSIGSFFDATTASWHNDMERLIKAAFISSINIFRDATMPTNVKGLNNIANVNGSLVQGVGDFILYSGQVTTLSPITLIVVPAVFLLLCCIRGIFWLAKIKFGSKKLFTDFNLRTINLDAAQIYRMYDEIKRDIINQWKGRTGRVPYIKEIDSPSQNPTGGSKAPGVDSTEVRESV